MLRRATGLRFDRVRARQDRTVAERKAMIDRSHALPLAAEARELGISRGAIYYEPTQASEADLALMRRIGELHLDFPFAGSRMMQGLLKGKASLSVAVMSQR